MKRTPSIRVLVIEDHPVVREGIRAILQEAPGIEVAGLTGSAEQGLAMVEERKPDVVVMDVELPEMDGLEATELLRRLQPEIKVILLTVHENAGFIERAAQAGASVYLLKNAPLHRIVESVRAVVGGGPNAQPPPAEPRARRQLTSDEERVLVMVVNGKSNKEIAQALGITARLAQSRRETIKDTLGIQTTAGLTKYAISAGLISVLDSGEKRFSGDKGA